MVEVDNDSKYIFVEDFDEEFELDY